MKGQRSSFTNIFGSKYLKKVWELNTGVDLLPYQKEETKCTHTLLFAYKISKLISWFHPSGDEFNFMWCVNKGKMCHLIISNYINRHDKFQWVLPILMQIYILKQKILYSIKYSIFTGQVETFLFRQEIQFLQTSAIAFLCHYQLLADNNSKH